MLSLAPAGKFLAVSRQGKCLFLALFIAGFSLVGCGQTESESDNLPQDERSKTVYLTNGDPLDIIKGAKLNRRSPLRPGNLENFNYYGLLSRKTFFERRLEGENADPEIVGKPEATKSQSVKLHRFKKLSHKSYLYTNADGASDLEFRLVEGRLDWTKAFGFDVTVLHYSVDSENKNRFSLLGSYEDPELGQVLLSLVFFKPEEKPEFSRIFLKNTEAVYNYLFGPNVVARWNKKKTISLCGVVPATHKEEIGDIRAAWQKALGDELEFKLEVLKEYPPFSDLNKSCIYWVNNFVLESHEEYLYLGRTVFSAYLPDAELVDSDIFMFEKEFTRLKELNADQVNPARERTLTHEIGHLLGLHHVFEGPDSIMSYDSKVKTITDYDREAIQALYK